MNFTYHLRLRLKHRRATLDTSVKIEALDKTHADLILNLNRDKIMKGIVNIKIIGIDEKGNNK